MTVNPQETTKAFQGKLTQAETNYVPLSATKGKACANCRWFLNDGCFLVESYEPEPIIATGYCDRWEATPEPPQDATEQIVEAVTEAVESIAETVSTMPSMYVEMSKALEQPNIMERIWKGLQEFIRPEKQQSDLVVIKGIDGKNYWLASFTNNFKDLEDEIISERAHKEFEMRLDMKLTPMPELWAWHTEGTKHGKALTVWYQDHDMFAIGVFDDTPEAAKSIEYYRKNPVKLSHGFVAPEWAFKNGVYDAYNTFEISTLPPSVAANPYTSFEEIKAMPVPEKREAFINKLFGDKAPDVLAKVNAKNEASKELGELVEFKDFVSPTSSTSEADPEVNKELGALYTQLVDESTELIKYTKYLTEKLSAKDTEIAALKSEKDTQVSELRNEIEAIKAQVNMPPSRASQVTQTLTNEKDGLSDKLPQKPDTFYGDLLMPTPAKPAQNGAR